ncbi:AAA family ATPase [Methylobacterium persicinum]|uniref:MoxR-like ATPase n=1 Tax=Methylobacterium persicinum TaxID=374426 RepID=A0ABU0HRU5_9HYPH|nr:MoxR family ATPase [Methylobacterium persicinum]MDQ0445051.1 MoxR-like ATPase [Methylobacterium persicinum]GJE40675.1 ATPase RavA [Methylobacterium persicinum]
MSGAILADRPQAGSAASDLHGRVLSLRDGLETGLIGASGLVERLLIGLLTGGHLLIEGAPGLAKTRAVKRLAEGLDGSFARIQCTPDLMPADLTGTTVWRQDSGHFEFLPGPLFHALVLVDEVNRAPPKVQSALLESMAEGQVTVSGETHRLPDPFMVVATQNPIEHAGTFPLPEAQLDRFLLHVVVDMPDAASERAILDLVEGELTHRIPPMPTRLTMAEVRAAREAALSTYVSPALKDYLVRLVAATRTDEAAPDLRGAIEHPASPRGTLALMMAGKARAWLRGRDHVIPEDVTELARDALSHRIGLTWRASAEGRTARGLIEDLVRRVKAL